MTANSYKTRTVSHTRRANYTVTRYYVKNKLLHTVQQVKDLGVVYDEQLLAGKHVLSTIIIGVKVLFTFVVTTIIL